MGGHCSAEDYREWHDRVAIQDEEWADCFDELVKSSLEQYQCADSQCNLCDEPSAIR